MTTFDTIIERSTALGWTHDGAAYCPDHKPAPDALGDRPAPVFRHEASSWEDGGLTCDTCETTIVASDTCRQCDKSLRDDHDSYSFGPADHALTHADAVCRPHTANVVRVREAYSPGRCAVHSEIVPGTVVDALDAIVAAYAGRVATFEIVESEEIAS